MSVTATQTEIALRIAELLKTRRVGQAVADCLETKVVDRSDRDVIADVRTRRVEPRPQVAPSGRDQPAARQILLGGMRLT